MQRICCIVLSDQARIWKMRNRYTSEKSWSLWKSSRTQAYLTFVEKPLRKWPLVRLIWWILKTHCEDGRWMKLATLSNECILYQLCSTFTFCYRGLGKYSQCKTVRLCWFTCPGVCAVTGLGNHWPKHGTLPAPLVVTHTNHSGERKGHPNHVQAATTTHSFRVNQFS